MVDLMKQYLPMDSFWISPLYGQCSSPMCRYCHLVETIITEATDFIPFFVGFTAKSLRLNLVSSAVVSLIFAVIYYELEVINR